MGSANVGFHKADISIPITAPIAVWFPRRVNRGNKILLASTALITSTRRAKHCVSPLCAFAVTIIEVPQAGAKHPIYKFTALRTVVA